MANAHNQNCTSQHQTSQHPQGKGDESEATGANAAAPRLRRAEKALRCVCCSLLCAPSAETSGHPGKPLCGEARSQLRTAHRNEQQGPPKRHRAGALASHMGTRGQLRRNSQGAPATGTEEACTIREGGGSSEPDSASKAMLGIGRENGCHRHIDSTEPTRAVPSASAGPAPTKSGSATPVAPILVLTAAPAKSSGDPRAQPHNINHMRGSASHHPGNMGVRPPRDFRPQSPGGATRSDPSPTPAAEARAWLPQRWPRHTSHGSAPAPSLGQPAWPPQATHRPSPTPLLEPRALGRLTSLTRASAYGVQPALGRCQPAPPPRTAAGAGAAPPRTS